MLCFPGLDCKSYAERLADGQPLPELACPDPGCPVQCLRGHGWYRRFLGGVLRAIRRLRCPVCKVTHALLPEDVCAYHDLTLGDLEAALDAGGGPSSAARAAGQSGAAGVRRARRWQRAMQLPWTQELVAFLPPGTGSLLERARAAMEDAPSALVWLRRELWSKRVDFLSGLTGLYRHGRPHAVVVSGSTEFGNCPSSP